MKTLTFFLSALLVSVTTLAQTKSISLEVGLRGNLPEQVFNPNVSDFNEQKAGLGLELMPKWNLSETKSIGINFGFNMIAENPTTDNIGTFQILSYVPTFKHQLLKTKFSPFYGLGLGGYSVLNSETAAALGISLSIGTTLFGKGAISFEYNDLLTNIKVNEGVINGFDYWNYFGIKLSYDIKIK